MRLEGNYLAFVLRSTPLPQFGVAIQKEMDHAYLAMRQYTPGGAELGLPSLGLTISLRQALVIAGPVLLIGLMIFAAAAFSDRHADAGPPEPSFPRFQSPDDPFAPPFPASTGEVMSRLIWAGFLVLPLSILTFGVLTRYDLYSIESWSHTGATWAGLLLGLRSEDPTSLFVDQVTLVCLCAASFITIELTKPASMSPKATLLRTGIVLAACAVVAAVAATRDIIEALAVVFVIGVVAAGVRGTRLMLIASATGLVSLGILSVVPAG